MSNGEKPPYSVIEVKEKLSLMTQEEMTILYWRCNGYSNSQISVNTGIKLRDVSKIMEEIYKQFNKIEGQPQTKRVAFNRCVCDVVKLVITSEAELGDWVNIKARLAQELEEAFPEKYKVKPKVKLQKVEKPEIEPEESKEEEEEMDNNEAKSMLLLTPALSRRSIIILVILAIVLLFLGIVIGYFYRTWQLQPLIDSCLSLYGGQ